MPQGTGEDVKFLPALQSFLRAHKVIYTVRGYDMRRAGVVVGDIGACRRIPLGEIHYREDLESYVKLSGFDNIESWWSKIEEFIIPGERMWLYKVEVI